MRQRKAGVSRERLGDVVGGLTDYRRDRGGKQAGDWRKPCESGGIAHCLRNEKGRKGEGCGHVPDKGRQGVGRQPAQDLRARGSASGRPSGVAEPAAGLRGCSTATSSRSYSTATCAELSSQSCVRLTQTGPGGEAASREQLQSSGVSCVGRSSDTREAHLAPSWTHWIPHAHAYCHSLQSLSRTLIQAGCRGPDR